MRILVLTAFSVVMGCSSDTGSQSDSNAIDTGTPTDSKGIDTGTPADSKGIDTGSPTTSTNSDTGSQVDSTIIDTGGKTDSGVVDSGAKTDSATASDTATPTDSGVAPVDSGPPPASGLAVPPGTATVAKPTGAVGGLKVVSWAGFKAAVTYTFDDANQSQVDHYSSLEALGVHYTFFLIGAKVATNLSAWKQAIKDGHEIGNHTQTHDGNDGTFPGYPQDISEGQTTIENALGITLYTMAAPNGDAGYSSPAQTYYFMNRGVADGLYMAGNETAPSPFNGYCYIPPASAPASDFNSEVDGAVNGGGWRVVLVHGFVGGTDGAYQPVNLSDFVSGVNYTKSKGNVWIDTYMNVGAYWRGGNAVAKATAATSGSNTTYTWTLPAHFPPGKYIRVTVTGGTPSQRGTALAWDPHGYYEVSLDAGSLTLGP